MIKVCLIGVGKMGISHLSILGAHPDVQVVGICDTSKMVLDVLKKYSGFQCYSDYEQMLEDTEPDAVFVSVPTKYHADMVRKVLEKGKHVFAEKPLCLTAQEGKDLVYMGKVGTGWSRTVSSQIRKQLDTMVSPQSKLTRTIRKPKATWVEPRFYADVEYRDITSESLLRASSFKGLARK